MLNKHSSYYTNIVQKYYIYIEQHYKITLHLKKWSRCLRVNPSCEVPGCTSAWSLVIRTSSCRDYKPQAWQTLAKWTQPIARPNLWPELIPVTWTGQDQRLVKFFFQIKIGTIHIYACMLMMPQHIMQNLWSCVYVYVCVNWCIYIIYMCVLL